MSKLIKWYARRFQHRFPCHWDDGRGTTADLRTGKRTCDYTRLPVPHAGSKKRDKA